MTWHVLFLKFYIVDDFLRQPYLALELDSHYIGECFDDVCTAVELLLVSKLSAVNEELF